MKIDQRSAGQNQAQNSIEIEIVHIAHNKPNQTKKQTPHISQTIVFGPNHKNKKVATKMVRSLSFSVCIACMQLSKHSVVSVVCLPGMRFE